MPIKIHLLLSILTQIGLIVGTPLFGIFLFGNSAITFITMIFFAFAFFFVARFVFCSLIPAKCPNVNCGNIQSYQERSKPLIYVCRECKYEHVTCVSEGDEC